VANVGKLTQREGLKHLSSSTFSADQGRAANPT
jgi:hypothetical protein